MKKFYVTYLDRYGDLEHVWVIALDEEDAKIVARSEYWDIEEIVQVREEKKHY